MQKTLSILILINSISYANITGEVYTDFNMNGIKDKADTPLKGIALKAVCTDGKTYVATTNSIGAYTLSGFPAESKCRVEADPSSAGFGSGTNSPGSAPLVDIVSDGATHNISVGSSSSYCQENPNIIMTALPGYSTQQGVLVEPDIYGTIFQVPSPAIGSFNDDGTIDSKRTVLTTFNQTGAIWGTAWEKGSKNLFVASNLKRYVPLGGDAGAIYKIDTTNGNEVSVFTTVPDATSADIASIISARTYGQNEDKGIMPYVGRQGLGDLDISEDETKLYTVNMNKKELVIIDVASGKILQNIAIPNPYGAECPDTSVRPWALKTRGLDVFIGSVCETGIENGVGAVIQKYDGITMTKFTQTNSLQYLKPKWVNPKGSAVGDSMKYHNWGEPNNGKSSPILTDIEFTNSGDLVLGYINRDAYNRESVLNGDIRKMCLNVDGTYTDESTEVAPTTCSSREVTYSGNSEVYHEFYVGDHFGDNLGETKHPETASGSLAVIPGTENIVVGMIDATDLYQPGSIGIYSSNTGEQVAAQAIIKKDESPEGEQEPYGSKSGGMGDVELLCDPAPIEIGNYVWSDINKDGLQDPGEPAVPNVPIKLSCGGALIGTTTTDDNGHYYFGGLDNANLIGSNTLKSGENCTLSIAKSDLNNRSVTTTNPNSNANDIIDNDAVEDGANSVINFVTTTSNNHSFDFGITPEKGEVASVAPVATGAKDCNCDSYSEKDSVPALGGIWMFLTMILFGMISFFLYRKEELEVK